MAEERGHTAGEERGHTAGSVTSVERGAPHAAPHEPPAPTIWPATLAAGIALVATGIATSALISVGGLVLLLLAIQGWVRELVGGPPSATGEEPARGGSERHG